MSRYTVAEYTAGAAQAAPPAMVVGLKVFGISLSDWVAIGSGIFLAMQFAWFIYDKLKRRRKRE